MGYFKTLAIEERNRQMYRALLVIEWSVEDIHTAREELNLSKITDKEATVFLNSIEKPLTERSIEHGWEVIKNLLEE